MLPCKHAFQSLVLVASLLFLTACKNGGDLTLEPGARKDKAPGSPYVQVNQGGNAMIVEAGKTPTTGVHGWVTIQAIAGAHLVSPNGTSLVVNKTQ